MATYMPTGPSGPHPSLMTPFNAPAQGLTPMSLAALGLSPPGAPGTPTTGTGAPGMPMPQTGAPGAPQTPMQGVMKGLGAAGAVAPPKVDTPSAPGGGASGGLDTGQLMALLKMFGGAPQGAAMPSLGKLIG